MAAAIAPPTPETRPPNLPIRRVAAVVVGNALEFYDFLTYAFFAVQIGECFFPAKTAGARLLLSLATFGAGFLTRPLGALVIGRMADRIGRRPAMLLSFSLMGGAIVGLALTPSYRAIGLAAPILAVVFRLIQGFALGGEVGPTTAYLVEAAPPGRRGFYGSLQYMTQDFAVLCAGLIGVVLANRLTPDALNAWGWRVAMLVGALVVPVGLIVRRGLPETLDAPAPSDASAPSSAPLAAAALGLLMLAGGTIANYTLDYMTTYASATLHMPARLAFGATVVVGLCGVVFDPIGGWLSDRFGRKPVMMIPWIMLLLAVFPAFFVIARFRNALALYGASGVMAILLCLATPAVLISITETLPRPVRAGALALTYALAISVFGGSAQFIVTWLIQATGSPLAPAFYMAGFVAVGLVAMSRIGETAPAHRRAGA